MSLTRCVMQSAVDWTVQLQPVLIGFPQSVLWLNYTCLIHKDFLWEQGLWQWHHLLFRFNFLCLQNKSSNEAITKLEEAAKLRRADINKTAMGKEWRENKRWWIRRGVSETKCSLERRQKDFHKCWDTVQLLFVFFMWSLLNLFEVNLCFLWFLKSDGERSTV